MARAASKPASKAPTKPASKAAAKPASKAAPASKATAPVPASKARPSSSRARPSTSAPAPAPAQDEDIEMKDESTTTTKAKANGDAKPVSKSSVPAKRGRVGAIVDAEKKNRRRSSLGGGITLPVPQIPDVAKPRKAVFMFGNGDMGQLGLGPDTLDEIPRPRIHAWFEEKAEDGELSRDGKSGGGLETIYAGGMHNLAIDEGGKVRSWGINDNASLGRITSDVPDPNNPGSAIPNEDLETYPYVIDALEKEGFRAVQVAAGDSISVAVNAEGDVRAWGSFRGDEGKLGFNQDPKNNAFQFTPVALPRLSKIKIVQVSCGNDHVLALSSTGEVWVWGNGSSRQLGRRIIERRKLNGLEPERLGLRRITHVNAGKYHSFALDSNGIVWAWGLNGNRQCGIDTDRTEAHEDLITIPTQVDGLHPDKHDGHRVVQISGGEFHSLFLFDNGEVWGCGRNDAHELGLSEDHPAQDQVRERTAEIHAEKQKAIDDAQKALDKISESNDEDAIAAATTALQGAQSALRIAPVEWIPEPVRIYFPPVPESYEVVPEMPPVTQPANNPIKQISAGTRHSLAVAESGHAYSWGLGQQCELGHGQNRTDVETPTVLRSAQLKEYNTIYASAGGNHCVLLAQKKSA